MTDVHYDRRLPKRTESFAWGRSIDRVMGGHVLTYRLFRRDLKGALHISMRQFALTDHRRFIAMALRQMRKDLAAKVDAIGYALIEAKQATTQLQEVA